ncbi:MAG: ankyrin repeat domain-containing protein [Woeseiaceae bacterium]|nr:ankyrin repeat domain-containing protein [Woeseiaceae bacterium]
MFDDGFSPNALSKFNTPVIFLIAMVNDDPAVAMAFSKEAKARDEELTLVHMHHLGFVQTTVLHSASRNKSPAMLKHFIELGADIDLRDERERTPLHAAPGYSEDPQTYSSLLDAGVDPNAKDALGWTALHQTTRFSKNPEIFRILVEKGADVNARTDSGRTPLWIAENYRDKSVVDLLRSLGAE